MVSHWWVTPLIAIYLVHLKYVPHSKDLDEVMALVKCPNLK